MLILLLLAMVLAIILWIVQALRLEFGAHARMLCSNALEFTEMLVCGIGNSLGVARPSGMCSLICIKKRDV